MTAVRPTIDGLPAGTSPRATSCTVTLSAQDIEYLRSMGGESRKELLRSGIADSRNLVAVGIVLDAVAQLLIYRQVHPGAALVVGPILVSIPYAVARALTNRVLRLKKHPFDT